MILSNLKLFAVRPRNKHYQEDEEKKIKKVDNETAETHLSNRNHPHPKNTHIKKPPNTPPTHTHTRNKPTKRGGKPNSYRNFFERYEMSIQNAM